MILLPKFSIHPYIPYRRATLERIYHTLKKQISAIIHVTSHQILLGDIITKDLVERCHSFPWATLALIFLPDDITQGSPNFL